MNYNEINRYIGDIGRFQWRVFGIMVLFGVFLADSIHMNFIGGAMDHWCRVEELDGLPGDVQKKIAIPYDVTVDGADDVAVSYSTCYMFAHVNYSIDVGNGFSTWNRSEMLSNSTPVVKCQQWNYDRTVFSSTIVSKFNLVCGWNFLVPLVSTFFMLGVLVGAGTSGAISDRFGRKSTMLIFSVTKVVGATMSIFASEYIVFLIGRFLIGFGGIGFYLPGYVVVMELVGGRYRTWFGNLLHVAWSIGFMIQPCVAYFLRDEFTFQLAVLVPNAAFPFLILLFFPESPRWLFVKRKRTALVALLKNISRVNGSNLLSEDFNESQIDEVHTPQSGTFAALWTSKVVRFRAIVIHFSWFSCSLIYYALSLNTGKLHGNVYVNSFVSGALEIPSYIVGIFMMDYRLLGRRLTGCLSLSLAAVACFMCIPVMLFEFNRASNLFSMLGKAFVCIAYDVVYVYASELFPTEVRNIGLGVGSMVARVSAMGASFVGGPLTSVWKPLPSVLFGILSLTSGMCYLLLPETLGRPLPDTVRQEEMSAQPQGFSLCRATCCANTCGTGSTRGDKGDDDIIQNDVDLYTLADDSCQSKGGLLAEKFQSQVENGTKC